MCGSGGAGAIDRKLVSATVHYERELSKGTEIFSSVAPDAPVGEPVRHGYAIATPPPHRCCTSVAITMSTAAGLYNWRPLLGCKIGDTKPLHTILLFVRLKLFVSACGFLCRLVVVVFV
jgi:hypothetical protein